jgi:hypothetical protein
MECDAGIASQPAVYLVAVCHPRSHFVQSQSGLAVADLVFR